MSKAELGTKCTCAGCGQRFYDLNRTPGTRPKCGVEQPPEKPRAVGRPAPGLAQDACFGNRIRCLPRRKRNLPQRLTLRFRCGRHRPVPEPDEEIDDDVLEIVPGHDKEVA